MDQEEQILALRKSLLEVIEICEETNLVVAEMVVRFGDPHIMEPDYEKVSPFTLRDHVRMVEKRLRELREKWDLPKVVQ